MLTHTVQVKGQGIPWQSLMRLIGSAGIWLAGSLMGTALTIDEMDPSHAQPGEIITVGIAKLMAGSNVSAWIGEHEAQVESVEEERLIIRVPEGATTDRLKIQIFPEGDIQQSPFPVRITGQVSVHLDAEVANENNAFRAVGPFSESLDPLPTSMEVLAGAVTPVFAQTTDMNHLLMSVATGVDEPVEISPRSTVVSLVFTTGLFFTSEPDTAAERLSEIDSMPAVDTAETLLKASLESENPFISDPAFITAMGDVVTELIDFYSVKASGQAPTFTQLDHLPDPYAGFESGKFQDDVVKGIWDFSANSPIDLPEPKPFAIYNALNTHQEELGVSEEGLPVRIISLKPPRNEEADITRPNPVDWLAVIYEVDPDQFPFGKLQVETLSDEDYEKVFERESMIPIGQVLIPAPGGVTENVIKDLTVFGWYDKAVKFVGSALFPPRSPENLEVPLDRPGIYVVRAWSGCLFTPQNELVRMIPGGAEFRSQMLALNSLQVVLTGSGAALGATDALGGNELADITFGIYKEARTNLAREEAEGDLTSEDIDLFIASAGNALTSKLASSITGLLGGGGVSNFLRIQGAMLDAASADERYRGIISGSECTLQGCPNLTSLQTVETAIIMVGDPFAPIITSFWPTSGYRGQVVTINGHGFSSIPENNRVEFNAELTTDPKAPPEISAEVLMATENSLLVMVPEDAEEGIGLIRVQVLVDGSQNKTVLGVGDTSRNSPPMDNFEVIVNPVITGIEPSPVVVGSPMRIQGEHFPTEISRMFVFYEEDDVELPLQVLGINSENEILVRAPTYQTDMEVRVRVVDPDTQVEKTSNSYSAMVQAGSGETGWTFLLNSLADTVAADGFVTLREALLWASGSDDIHNPTPGEEFQISIGEPARPVGEGVSDVIQLDPYFMEGTPIIINSPLPPLTAHDKLFLQGRELVGTGNSGDGLRITGNAIPAEQVIIESLQLTGFAGNGLVLDGASNCTIDGLAINNSGLDGILLQNGSQYNYFHRVIADGNIGNGVHLSGPDTAYNEFTFSFEAFTNELLKGSTNDNGGWGVLVELGAHGNHIDIGDANENNMGGIGILNIESSGNSVGRQTLVAHNAYIYLFDNGGPGIRVEGPATRLRYIHAAGNAGDGIILEGEIGNCKVDTVNLGYGLDGNPHANLGSGLHLKGGVTDARIGVSALSFNAPPRSSIGGNQEHGIFLEEVSGIEICYALVGAEEFSFNELPNGGHGIYLLNSSKCTIGHHDVRLGVGVVENPDGAGIRLEGTNCFGNEIFGTTVGSVRYPFSMNRYHFFETNRYGIQVTGQAWGNIIGRRGEPKELRDIQSTEIISTYISNVHITGSTEAGILIESGLDPRTTFTPNSVPSGGNIVQNCDIGYTGLALDYKNRIGIILRNNPKGNRIGGNLPSEGNRIHGNFSTGILIDAVNINQPNLANRVIGNLVRQNYEFNKRLDRPPGFPNTPPTAGTGLGIHIRNSSNQPIGGTGPGEQNKVVQTGTGIFIEDSSNITISGNQIGSDRQATPYLGNDHAGIILDNCIDCVIGPDNLFLGNGIFFDPELSGSAAVTIYLGENNRVFGNWIGITPDGSESLGNMNGIYLIDTENSEIGGPTLADGNTIVSSTRNGIILEGLFCNENSVAGNKIGFYRDFGPIPTGKVLPNMEAGILLHEGAFENWIGEGTVTQENSRIRVAAGNAIYHSGGAGIRVVGSTTRKNRLKYNSITANSALGIDTATGGNKELIPPTITSFANGRVFGFVAEEIPDGSLVQVFTDSGDEGEVYKGEGKVKNDRFSIPIGWPVFNNLTATVTDPEGNTSEFGQGLELIAGLELNRTPGPVLEKRVLKGTNSTVAARLTARAVNADIQIDSIRLGGGNASEHINSVELFLDADKTGNITEEDILLAEVFSPFAGDNSSILPLSGHPVELFDPQVWILRIEIDESIQAETTLSLEIVSKEDVEISTLFPQGVESTPLGNFPLRSDNLLLVEADDPYYQWIIENFPESERDDPRFSAPGANPDRDSLKNLLERAFGTDPVVPNASPLSVELQVDRIRYAFPWSRSANDMEWLVELSEDANVWSPADVQESIEHGNEIDQVLAEIVRPENDHSTWLARFRVRMTGN